VSAPLLHRADLGLRNSTVAGALGLRPAMAQSSEAEGELLERAAQGARTIVEIGVAEGGSAYHLRRAMHPDGDLHLIDPYPKRYGMNMSSRIAKRLVEKVPHGHVHWHVTTSDDALGAWTEPIDFLFIDGDHAYDAVRRDFEGWSPHVRDTGTIAFHDALLDAAWMNESFGSARYVAELRGAGGPWAFAEGVDSLALFRRAG
jgi:predicted O-methyltransferase YrrM